MSDRDAFLRAILAEPDDDAARLVFADWLDEHNEPDRAAFIRLQIDSHRRFSDHPLDAAKTGFVSWRPPSTGLVAGLGAWSAAWGREETLRLRHAATWYAEVPSWATRSLTFRRGFIEEVVCSGDAFALRGAELFTRSPVRHLWAGGTLDPARLANAPHLARLSGLQFRGLSRFAEVLPALAGSPFVAGIRQLGLRKQPVGAADLAALAASPHFSGLEVLDIGGTDTVSMQRPRSRDLSALTGAAFLPRLRVLLTPESGLGDAGAITLSRMPLDRVRVLDLELNQIGPAGAIALAESPHLEHVAMLCLGGNPVGSVGAAALRERFAGRFEL